MNYEMIFSFLGSAVGCVAGILASQKLTNYRLEQLEAKVAKMLEAYQHLNIKVAVMGCAVNGPGEAKEADIGVAGGHGEGLIIKKGEIIRKVSEDEIVGALEDELKKTFL